jgi:hypothetical protein
VLLAIFRLCQTADNWKSTLETLASSFTTPDSTVRKILFLALLSATSLIPIIPFVGTPRYYIYITPLFYLALAFCANLIITSFRLVHFEPLILVATCIGFCSPNFIIPRPNYEADALRHVSSYVRTNPVVAAWWAEPDVLFGFAGKARPASIGKQFRQEDLTNGFIDILMLDNNFRGTKVWADHRDFYVQFEREPERFGFKKLTGVNAGRFDVYYRPKP